MLQEAADWLDAFDRDPDSGVLLDARKHIAALVAEVTRLREEKARTIRKAWDASQDYEEWPSLIDYIKQELGE